jgi:hypothetical protein
MDDVQFDDDSLDEGHEYTIPLSPRAIEALEPSSTWSGGGTCGVYLLCDKEGTGVAVFKPQDEEAIPEHAVGMIEGENMYRERAAYLVSRKLGDFGVPATIIKTISHPRLGNGKKIGSLQRFVPLSTDMSDLGPSGIPAEQVHKIGCLDILLFNVDRHEGNILLKHNIGDSSELVPIDHGLCLPEIVSREQGANMELLQGMFFAWQTWPQARAPFSARLQGLLSKLTRENTDLLIRALCKDRDVNLHLTLSSWTTLKVGATLLRTLAGHTLADIAALIPVHLPDLLCQSWNYARCLVLPSLLQGENDKREISSNASKVCDQENKILSLKAVGLGQHTQPDNNTVSESYLAWEHRFLSHFESALLGFVATLPKPKTEEGQKKSEGPDFVTESHSNSHMAVASAATTRVPVYDAEAADAISPATTTDFSACSAVSSDPSDSCAGSAPRAANTSCVAVKETLPEKDAECASNAIRASSNGWPAGCFPASPRSHAKSRASIPSGYRSHCSCPSSTCSWPLPSAARPQAHRAKPAPSVARRRAGGLGPRQGRWASCGCGAVGSGVRAR